MLTLNKKQVGAASNAQLGAQDTEIAYVPIAGASDFVAIAAASAQFTGIGATLVAGQAWRLTSTTDCYYQQGANPTAAAAAGSEFLQKGQPVMLDGAQGGKVALIQSAAGGFATIQRCDG